MWGQTPQEVVEKEGAVGAHPWLEEGCCKLCFLHEHHVVTRDSSGKKIKENPSDWRT